MKIYEPTILKTSSHTTKDGLPYITIDNLDEAIKNRPKFSMSKTEEAAWRRRVQKIFDTNEYYQQFSQ